MYIIKKYSQNISVSIMTIISFIILIVGGMNWMSIGLLQYDFIAGFFGTQASIFSRLLYIAIGVATFYIIFDMLKNLTFCVRLFYFFKVFNKSKRRE